MSPQHTRIPETDVRNIQTSENEKANVFEQIYVIISWVLVIATFPLSLFFCLIVVMEFQRAVIFRLGRLRKGGARGPGMTFVLPCLDEWVMVDLRTTACVIPTQDILTKESVSIKLDAVVYYRITDPLKSVIQVANVRKATQLLAQTTLRNVAGTQMLNELLGDKDAVAHGIETILDEATKPWGVKVERVEMKQVGLPHQMQRAMAVEQESIREAKAKVIAADGELHASQALKEASDILTTSPVSVHLRYLQTVSAIAAEKNHTVIFPLSLLVYNRIMDFFTNKSPAAPIVGANDVASSKSSTCDINCQCEMTKTTSAGQQTPGNKNNVKQPYLHDMHYDADWYREQE